MRALGFRFLPVAGGLLDQPEQLMADVLAIEAEYERMKDQKHG